MHMKRVATLFVSMILLSRVTGQDLPDWFFNPPKSNSNTFYTLGISDPGLTREQATVQAEHRAMLTFSLLQGVEVQGIEQSESNDLGEEIIEVLSRSVVSKSYPRLYFENVKGFFTSNNEAIVLLKTSFYDLPEELATDSLEFRSLFDCSSHSSFSQSDGSEQRDHLEYLYRCTDLKNQSISTDYYRSFHLVGGSRDSLYCMSILEIASKSKNIKKTTELTDDYTYDPPARPPTRQYSSLFPNQIHYTATLKRGIWYAYITSMMNEIYGYSSKKTTRTKVPNETKQYIIFALNNIEFRNDSLTLHLNVSDPFSGDFYTYSAYENVDKNVPVAEKTYPFRFALIIGNEDYSMYQPDLKSETNVQFAVNDANVFAEYAQFTLGIPEENITLLTNARAIDMYRAIEKLSLLIKNAYGKADVFFYYAGHGLPDEKTRDAYIIPCDVSGADLQFAIKLKDLYAKLSEFPSKRITVFLDACFSGGARNLSLVASRSVKTKPNEDEIAGNIVVFTASTGEQSALPYQQKNHGLFTYFLLKKLQDTRGDLNYAELSSYLTNEIGINSLRINTKEQNSKTLFGTDVAETWSEWKFQY